MQELLRLRTDAFILHLQCDQMARLSIQNLAIFVNGNWPNGIKNYHSRSNTFQIQNNSTKNVKRLLKFCQSGEIPPNLVTLLTCHHDIFSVFPFLQPLESLERHLGFFLAKEVDLGGQEADFFGQDRDVFRDLGPRHFDVWRNLSKFNLNTCYLK